MSKQSTTNQFVDEWALFVKAVSYLALLTGFLYLRAMVGQGAPLAAGDNLFTTGATRVVLTVVAIAGLIGCWRRAQLGATVAIVAGLLLGWQVYNTALDTPLVLALGYASPFVITGALYLLYAWRHGHDTHVTA